MHQVSQIINRLLERLDKKKQSSYLEIGVDRGLTFSEVKAETKHGVDPYGVFPGITHRMTSQMYFSMNYYFYKHKYDVVFIDGCHMAYIIEQEFKEAFNILNDNGYIILHDTYPSRESAQYVLQEEYERYLKNVHEEKLAHHESYPSEPETEWTGYNGDSWKVVSSLIETTDLEIYTIKDACCSIIKKGNFNKIPYKRNKSKNFNDYTWNDFDDEAMMSVSFLDFFNEKI
tara:strand:+ start:49 stop:738 length:690 start_codon:yes stop_codon:yes gene_type:complete